MCLLINQNYRSWLASARAWAQSGSISIPLLAVNQFLIWYHSFTQIDAHVWPELAIPFFFFWKYLLSFNETCFITPSSWLHSSCKSVSYFDNENPLPSGGSHKKPKDERYIGRMAQEIQTSSSCISKIPLKSTSDLPEEQSLQEMIKIKFQRWLIPASSRRSK